MKSILLAAGFCLLLATLGVRAQGNASPPDIEVVKYTWSKERIGWERDPFNATSETFYAMRDRVATERKQRSAIEERNMRVARDEQSKPPPPPRYIFNYKVSLTNNSGKPIKEIDWDYVFTDAVTGDELGRRQFTSTESIAAGKRKELSVMASAPPAQRISVYTLGKKEREGLVEKVVVLRILYADDTVWNAPN